MKKLLIYFACAAAVLAVGCSKYDDSELTNRVDNLESRVEALEALCKQMNANISSLQTIANAVESGDYITSIAPMTENGVEVGYTITFAKSAPITIYHGQDGAKGDKGDKGDTGAAGAAGATPVIGVKADTDGVLYWTLDGEWLLDSNGQKIRVTGEKGDKGDTGATGPQGPQGETGTTGSQGPQGDPGADGITPQLKIADDYWHISYDNGATWTRLGRATGEKGDNGPAGSDGDAFFQDVSISTDYVTFILADGTEFKVPYYSQLTITLDEEVVTMRTNATCSVSYTIVNSSATVEIEVVSSGDLKARVEKESDCTGRIDITAGETIDEYSYVLVLVSDGEKTVMKKITVTEDEFLYPYDFPDPVFCNYVFQQFDTDGDGKISKKDEALLNVTNLRFSTSSRLTSLEGIQYFTNLTELICFECGLTKLDLSHNTALTALYCHYNQLTYLNVSGCTKLETLHCYFNNLASLDVSNNEALTDLQCKSNNLTTLDVSKNTALRNLQCESNNLTTLDVSKNTALSFLSCYSNNLTDLDVSQNTALTYLHCHSNNLTDLDVSQNTALTSLYCGSNNLTDLNVSQNTKLETLSCGSNKLKDLDISHNPALTGLDCSSNLLNAIDVTPHMKLTSLNCGSNQLTMLDVSQNPALTRLQCNFNQLKKIDLSNNVRLEYVLIYCNPYEEIVLGDADPQFYAKIGDGGGFYGGSFQLCDSWPDNAAGYGEYCKLGSTKLKVSGNKITSLAIWNCNLESLDVSECPALTYLHCHSNNLTILDVSHNTALTDLRCDSNKLTTLDVSQTNLGNSNEAYPLDCAPMPSLQTLILKNGWSIPGITDDADRSPEYIPVGTVITRAE